MHLVERPEVSSLVHRLLPGFEHHTSDVPKQQMKTPANRRTGEVTTPIVSTEQNMQIGLHRRIDYQEIGVSDSNVQHNRSVHRRSGVPATGDRRPATSESPYQIPTFNTTDWYTGEAAHRRISCERNNTTD